MLSVVCYLKFVGKVVAHQTTQSTGSSTRPNKNPFNNSSTTATCSSGVESWPSNSIKYHASQWSLLPVMRVCWRACSEPRRCLPTEGGRNTNADIAGEDRIRSEWCSNVVIAFAGDTETETGTRTANSRQQRTRSSSSLFSSPGKMLSFCGTEESKTDVLVIPLAPWCNISAWANLETSCRPNHNITSLLVSSGNKSNRDGTRFHRIQTRKWDGYFYSHHAIARTRCTITTAWCWGIISINVAVALNVRIIRWYLK